MKKILEYGHIRLTLVFTIFSIVSAELIVYVFINLFNFPYRMYETPILTALITLLLIPFFLWYTLGLLMKIKKIEQKMNRLSTVDSMTSLLKREPFFEKLKLLHIDIIKNNYSYCILMIDIDNFKNINDTYGHMVGDEVLVQYGKLVKEVFSNKDDILARIDGAEFVIVTSQGLTKAKELAEELRERFLLLKILKYNEPLECSVSIGLCENTREKYYALEESIYCAEKALRYSKLNGKNRVTVHPLNHN